MNYPMTETLVRAGSGPSRKAMRVPAQEPARNFRAAKRAATWAAKVRPGPAERAIAMPAVAPRRPREKRSPPRGRAAAARRAARKSAPKQDAGRKIDTPRSRRPAPPARRPACRCRTAQTHDRDVRGRGRGHEHAHRRERVRSARCRPLGRSTSRWCGRAPTRPLALRPEQPAAPGRRSDVRGAATQPIHSFGKAGESVQMQSNLISNPVVTAPAGACPAESAIFTDSLRQPPAPRPPMARPCPDAHLRSACRRAWRRG